MAEHKSCQAKVVEAIQAKIQKYRSCPPTAPYEEQLEQMMHLLAVAKIFVFTFKKNELVLVEAHRRLGEVYFAIHSYKQSLEHLLIARRRSQDALNCPPSFQHNEWVRQNRKILLALAETLNCLKQYQQAKQVLNDLAARQAVDHNPQFQIRWNYLLARVLANIGNFSDARLASERSIELTKAQFGQHSVRYAKSLAESAHIFHMEGNNSRARKLQQQCIDTLIDLDFDDFKQIPDFYITLGKYCGLLKDSEAQLKALNKAKTILLEVDPNSKKNANLRRKIAQLYETFSPKDAVQQYKEIIKIDGIVFGETSVQLAKSYRCLAMAQLKLGRKMPAKSSLQMAIKLFNENFQKEQSKECQNILSTLREETARKPSAKKLILHWQKPAS